MLVFFNFKVKGVPCCEKCIVLIPYPSCKFRCKNSASPNHPLRRRSNGHRWNDGRARSTQHMVSALRSRSSPEIRFGRQRAAGSSSVLFSWKPWKRKTGIKKKLKIAGNLRKESHNKTNLAQIIQTNKMMRMMKITPPAIPPAMYANSDFSEQCFPVKEPIHLQDGCPLLSFTQTPSFSQ